MNWMRVAVFSFILLISQVVADGLASYIVFAYTMYDGTSVHLLVSNYLASFVVSTSILSVLAFKQFERPLLHTGAVAFFCLSIGSVLSCLFIEELMPASLYLADIAFTICVVFIATKLGVVWRVKECSSYS